MKDAAIAIVMIAQHYFRDCSAIMAEVASY
jgi:hypothetical protein